MFDAMVTIKLDQFPNSFKALQQECFLINSCLLTGFEFIVKGNFSDINQGHYYAALFQLSIGIERIMKLVIISDHILDNIQKNNKQIVHDSLNKDLKNLGHNLFTLHAAICKLSKKYNKKIFSLEKDGIDHKILDCINSFAQASGRYYHISNIKSSIGPAPLDFLRDVHKQIVDSDLSYTKKTNIEGRLFKSLNISLQLDDIANNTGYVRDCYNELLTKETNPYVVLRLVKFLNPIIELLDEFSHRCHVIETTQYIKNYPTIPYYGEFFTFRHSTRQSILNRKRWTDVFK